MDQHATTPFQTCILKQPTTSEYRQLVLTTGQVHSHLQELQQHYLSVSILHHREIDMQLISTSSSLVDTVGRHRIMWLSMTWHVAHKQPNRKENYTSLCFNYALGNRSWLLKILLLTSWTAGLVLSCMHEYRVFKECLCKCTTNFSCHKIIRLQSPDVIYQPPPLIVSQDRRLHGMLQCN